MSKSSSKRLLHGATALMMSSSLTFGLACFIDGEDNNNDNNNRPGTNNAPGRNNVNGGSFGGDVKTTTTWSGKIQVTRSVYVRDGGELKIEPGTEIIMCADCELDLGYFRESATFALNGTAEKPIVIRGAVEASGFWRGVRVGSNVTSLSALKHVQIKHAGGADTPALRLERAVLLEDVLIDSPANVGVQAEGFAQGSRKLTVRAAKGAPVVATNSDAVFNFPAEDDLSGDQPWVRLDFENIRGKGAWRALSVPYRATGKGLYLREDSELDVEAGAAFLMPVDSIFELGYFREPVSFKLAGTAEKPIVIKGVDETPGAWLGVRVGDNARSTSSLEHVTVRHGGGDSGQEGGVSNGAKVIWRHVTVEQTKGPGLVIGEDGFADTSTDVIVKGSTGRAAYVHSKAVLTMPTGFQAIDNADNRVELHNGNIEGKGTLRDFGVPYLVSTDLSLRDGADVTFEPGLRLEFGVDSQLDLGYFRESVSFTIEGTPEKPIILTAADPSPGSWDGVFVNPGASSSSTIKHAQILFGGKDDGANLTMEKDIAVEDVKLERSAGFGLRLQGPAQSKDYSGSGNSFSGNAKGDIQGK